MGNPIKKHPRIGDSNITVDDAIPLNSVTQAMATAGLRAVRDSTVIPTVPTAAGTTEVLFQIGVAGTLSVARVTFKDALTAHDTNFVTFALKNKTQASADMLSTAAANTSKVTGGAAVAAYGSRSLTLNGTPANLVVAAGDVLAFQVTGAGTLANTLTEGNVRLVFDPS